MYSIKATIFQGISKEDCLKIMVCLNAQSKEFVQGETIFKNNDEKDKIGVVQKGVVIIERIDYQGNRTILERVEEGGIFGETIAFSNYGNNLSVTVAESYSQIIFINYSQITKICSNACACHITLINNILAIISEKAMRLSEHIEILSNRTIREKLYSYFNLQGLKQNSNTFELPFTMSALAEYLCIDRSAMMRELKHMKEEQIVEVQKRTIRLKY